MASKEFIHAMNQLNNLEKKVSGVVEQIDSLQKNVPTKTVSSFEPSVNLKAFALKEETDRLLDSIQKRLDNIENTLSKKVDKRKVELLNIEDITPDHPLYEKLYDNKNQRIYNFFIFGLILILFTFYIVISI